MKKSDLKDGMVIIFDRDEYAEFSIINRTRLYNHDRKFICGLNVDDDVMDDLDNIRQVFYMGELLWERKKYVTFDEARRSGKMLKHKEWDKFYDLFDVLSIVQCNATHKDVNDRLDSKEWEIEN